jgi:hypothetical protein
MTGNPFGQSTSHSSQEKFGQACPSHSTRPPLFHRPAAPGGGGRAPHRTRASAALHVVGAFRRRGLRERLLTLPVMVAWVLALVWRPIGGVTELAHVVQQEVVLWVPPLKASAQALEQRLRCLLSEWFRQVLERVLPLLHEAWPKRQRPLPEAIAWAPSRFSRVLVCDASTLDVLLRKVGLLQGAPQSPLAGRITARLDLGSRLPWRVWFEPDPKAHEQNHWPHRQPLAGLVLFLVRRPERGGASGVGHLATVRRPDRSNRCCGRSLEPACFRRLRRNGVPQPSLRGRPLPARRGFLRRGLPGRQCQVARDYQTPSFQA